MRKRGLIKTFIIRITEKIENMMKCLTILGLILTVSSCCFNDKWFGDCLLGIGSGIMTSSIVSFLIEKVNIEINEKKRLTMRSQVLKPLVEAVRAIYRYQSVGLGEYLIKVKQEYFMLLPFDKNNDIRKYIEELKNENDDLFERNLSLLNKVPDAYYKNLSRQITNIQEQHLFLEEYITSDELYKFEKASIFGVYQEYIEQYSRIKSDEKGLKSRISLDLFFYSIYAVNELCKVFEECKNVIQYENRLIQEQLNDLYFQEVIENSEEYIDSKIKECEDREEYYFNQRMLDEEKQRLYEFVSECINTGDKGSLLANWNDIKADDLDIRQLFTSVENKKFMNDKVLRRKYEEKYGQKYKVQKDLFWGEKTEF